MKKIDRQQLLPQIKEVGRLSLPAILTQITTIVMQYIDSAMVGALGANASASIGLVSSSTWLMNSAVYAVSAGFSVQVAHRIGAGKDDAAKDVLRHGLVTAALVSGVMCLIALLISGPLPMWLGGDAAIRADASAYFVAFALTMPFFQLNNLCSSCLQCAGDMMTPSILNALMCVLDVGFNALLIPKFGVLGAGIGTGLACAVIGLVMCGMCCLRNKHLRLLHAAKGRFDRDIMRKAVRIGLPVAVQEAALCGAMVVSTVIIAPLGAVAIAANSFAVTAESLCYMPGYGVGSAATTLVGRSVGAGKPDLAKRYGYICTVLGGGFMTLTGLVMMVICPFIFAFLTPDPAVRELAATVLRIELLAEPLFGVSIVAAGALRGAGDTLVPSLLNLVSIWIVRLGLALLLVPAMGLRGMWIAMAAELCFRGLVMLVRQVTSKHYTLAARAEHVAD